MNEYVISGQFGYWVIALTCIERFGVYIQIIGANLTAQQLLETADSLREQ